MKRKKDEPQTFHFVTTPRIPRFNWSDLHGKTLKVHVSEDDYVQIAVGIDEVGTMYVLYCELREVPPYQHGID